VILSYELESSDLDDLPVPEVQNVTFWCACYYSYRRFCTRVFITFMEKHLLLAAGGNSPEMVDSDGFWTPPGSYQYVLLGLGYGSEGSMGDSRYEMESSDLDELPVLEDSGMSLSGVHAIIRTPRFCTRVFYHFHGKNLLLAVGGNSPEMVDSDGF